MVINYGDQLLWAEIIRFFCFSIFHSHLVLYCNGFVSKMIVIILIIAFLAYLVLKIVRFFQNLRVPEGIKNVPTFSYLDLLFHIFTKGGPDKRWENTRRVLEKEGIGRVIFLYAFYSFFII